MVNFFQDFFFTCQLCVEYVPRGKIFLNLIYWFVEILS